MIGAAIAFVAAQASSPARESTVRRRLPLMLALVLCGGEHLHATIVVVLATADRIVVAADSRQTRWSDEGPPDDSACKIWQQGSAAFAASGHVFAEGFHDVRRIAPDAVSQPGSALDKYRWSLDSLRKQRMSPYPATDVVLILAAFEEQQGPSLAFEKLPLPLSPLFHSKPQHCVGDCVVALAVTPERNAIDTSAAYARLKERPNEQAMVALAKSLVDLQAGLTPVTVGGPTDVLVLDASGARWAERKPNCGL